MAKKVDFSPRRIWLGLTVPGKKMMVVLDPEKGVRRGQELIELYRGEAHQSLIGVALALHLLPERGAVGPAFRDLTKPVQSGTFFDAALTDIRDFLKLRFRASGLPDSELTSLDVMLEGLKTRRYPDGVEPAQPELVINYAITALDALSRDRERKEDLPIALANLRDLLRATSKMLNPRRGLDATIDEASDKLEDSIFENPGS